MACYFFGGMRYFVLVLATFALTLIISNSLVLNFTIICMKKDEVILTTNRTTERNDSVHEEMEMFSSRERSALFSAIPIGTLLGSVPITVLTTKFGIRKVLMGYGMLATFATFLLPSAVPFGAIAVFVLRVLQGIAIAISFVAMGAISAEWSPLAESGLYLSWISCHFQFGPMITMSMAGVLCEHVGWESVYYVHGAISVVIYALFFYFFRDSPRDQKNVGEGELRRIEKNKLISETRPKTVPYAAMLKDIVVWGIMSTSAFGMLGFYLIMHFGPVYLNKALKMEITETGIAAALPFALSAVVKILAGPISDRVTCLSEKGRVIFFAAISQYMMAVCYTLLTFLPTESMPLIQTAFTSVIVFSGLSTVGVVKSTHLTAGHFSHIIMAWNTLITSVIVLILPYVIAFFVPDNTTDQWGHVFLGVAVLIVVGNTFFIATAEVEPRSWSFCGEKNATGNNKRRIYTVDSIKNLNFDEEKGKATSVNERSQAKTSKH